MNMKKYINTISAALLIMCFASSCVDLNMNPPSEASSENWYKNADQITMSLNDLYRKAFYGMESEYWTDRRTDDWAQRDYTYELVNVAPHPRHPLSRPTGTTPTRPSAVRSA